MGRFGAQIGLEQVQNRPKDRQAGKPERAALVFEARCQIFLQQRVEHDAGTMRSASSPVTVFADIYRALNAIFVFIFMGRAAARPTA
jgi:hypothetical protein